MANLQFDDFALIPGSVRKEKQFRLPGHFCKIDVTIFSQMSHPVSGFPAVFNNTDRPLFSDQQNVLHNENHEKFQHFRSQRKKSSLTSRFIVKGKISGGNKGFSSLIKASIMKKILLKFGLLSTLLDL